MSIKNVFSLTQISVLDKEFNKISSKIKMLEDNSNKNIEFIQLNIENNINQCNQEVLELANRLKKIRLLAIICIGLNIVQIGAIIYERI